MGCLAIPVLVIVTGGHARIARVAGARRRPAGSAVRRAGQLPGAPAAIRLRPAYPDAPVQPVYPPSGPVPPRS